jgi:hypothetical protein
MTENPLEQAFAKSPFRRKGQVQAGDLASFEQAYFSRKRKKGAEG